MGRVGTGPPAVEIKPHKLTSNGGIITVLPCLDFLAGQP
jgi:hypothetical protein